MKVYYNPNIKSKAQKLRQDSTFAERLLWKHIKKKQLLGYQFSRQKPIDEYIVDFYCNKLNLIIEIDGISHNNKE
jgi:very-short-patch-repair endonuclease